MSKEISVEQMVESELRKIIYKVQGEIQTCQECKGIDGMYDEDDACMHTCWRTKRLQVYNTLLIKLKSILGE